MYKSLFEQMDEKMKEASDIKNAASMEKYMKGLFSYYGVKSPVRKGIESDVIRENSEAYKNLDLDSFLNESWEHDKREMQYVGLDILERKKGWKGTNDLDKIEHLIQEKSWWDTVDGLASNAVGKVLGLHPEIKNETIVRYINHDNMWMRRTALICQLKHRNETNFELMKECILQTAHEKEFFIRKAAGWALRQYSKFNGSAVIKFVHEYEGKLSGLTKREALKWLDRQG